MMIPRILIRKFTITAVLVFAVFASAFSQNDKTGNLPPFSSSELTPEGAWCWFADPRAIHYENDRGSINSTYIGYIDVHGNIKASQIDYLKNKKSEVLIRSYFQPDDHNNPTFLVLPDERIMIFYSRHTDEPCFYYRISQKPGDITTLGKEVRLPTAHNTTYPSPFILSDDPEHFYLCWRGIGWHPTIARLTLPDENDEVQFDWGPFQIVRSSNGVGGVRPYAKYVSNGKNKIYLAYTTTHPDNQPENHIYLNYFDINTKQLKDIKGRPLATVGKGSLHDVDISPSYKETYPFAVVDNSPLRNWLWEIVLDREEKPVIAMVSISEDKKQHDYYYVHWTGSHWQKTFLANGGGHFHQTATTERCYSGGLAIDKTDPKIIYGSVPVEGKYGSVYELKKFVLDADGKLIAEQQVTFNSKKNNVRPFAIDNGLGKKSLTWMNGDYYHWIVSANHPEGYATSILTDIVLPKDMIDLQSGLMLQKNIGKLAAGSVSSFRVSKSNAFTIIMNLSFDTNFYYGRLLDFAGLSYVVPQDESPKPFLTKGSESFASTNVLGSADGWRKHNGGTGGQWYAPEYLKSFQLAISYQNGRLYTFINGLVDQYVEIPDLQLSDIKVGEFKGVVEQLKVYNKALSQDAIKTLLTQKSSQSL